MELACRPMRCLMRDGDAVTRAAIGRWASEGVWGAFSVQLRPSAVWRGSERAGGEVAALSLLAAPRCRTCALLPLTRDRPAQQTRAGRNI